MFTPVIAVGAVGANGGRAGFSTVHSYVSVSAPGVSVPALSVNGTPTTSTGQPPVAYTGARYFGQGPAADRLPGRPLFATPNLMLAIVFCVIGFGLVACAVLLYWRGRRPGPELTSVPEGASTYLGY